LETLLTEMLGAASAAPAAAQVAETATIARIRLDAAEMVMLMSAS
jgi:hypothetical protein